MKKQLLKSLVGISLLCLGVSAQADVSAQDLPGVYVLQMQDVFFQAKINIKADGTYLYVQQTMDSQIPEPGCSGKWTVNKNLFQGVLDCSKFGAPAGIRQQINLTKVSAADLKAGKKLSVIVESSLLQGPIPMQISKALSK